MSKQKKFKKRYVLDERTKVFNDGGIQHFNSPSVGVIQYLKIRIPCGKYRLVLERVS